LLAAAASIKAKRAALAILMRAAHRQVIDRATTLGPMDNRIRRALSRGHTIDLTTTGRRTGLPRRVELVFHAIDGRVYISGLPGFPRAWLANIRANPSVTFHLKGPVQADLPARAHELTEPEERRRIMEQVARNWGRTDVDRMMTDSPLIEVMVGEAA
jgi:deazaflavin-dependent oxidoreductase (nitroreductase family)